MATSKDWFEGYEIPYESIMELNNQPDVLEQIEKLAKLKESGILSEEEFNNKKAALLDKL